MSSNAIFTNLLRVCYSLNRLLQFKKTMSHLAAFKVNIGDVKKIIPPLESNLHKGECGRIGVIGGSREYTGAPYFSAMTALRLGADIVHVFCTESAGTPIKCYSPDLIVHPILDDENALYQILEWEKRLHAIVIGPGLGRDPVIMKLVGTLIEVLKGSSKPLIIDADGLHIVTQKPSLLENSSNVILTPNKIEFERLCTSVTQEYKIANEETALLKALGLGITVVKKGAADKIFDTINFCDVSGGTPCRCGGQGDVLSGCIALFTHWAMQSGVKNANLVGAYGGCYFTKQLNSVTFEELGRSMVTADFIAKIPVVYKKLFCT